MKEVFLNMASYFIDGKPIYPIARRLLNLLFVISGSSFIFESFYGNYNWLDISDYKGIINFFIKGKFFIPFSIFIVYYSISYFIATLLFGVLNHLKSVKLQRSLLAYQYKKAHIEQGVELINNVSTYVAPYKIDVDILLQAYGSIRNEINQEAFQEIEKSLKEPKKSLEENFILIFRALIAVTIFKFSLPEFSWLLYIITIVVFGTTILLINVAYWLLDIAPTFIRVLHLQVEQFYNEYTSQLNQNTNNK